MGPIYIISGLALIASITMNAAGCQTKLLEAGSSKYRLEVHKAIAADNAEVVEEKAKRITKLEVQISEAQTTIQNNAELHSDERNELNAAIVTALTEKKDWQCPGEEEWLRIASCSAPF